METSRVPMVTWGGFQGHNMILCVCVCFCPIAPVPSRQSGGNPDTKYHISKYKMTAFLFRERDVTLKYQGSRHLCVQGPEALLSVASQNRLERRKRERQRARVLDDQIAALAAPVRSELESDYVLHIFMSLCHQPEKQIPRVGALLILIAMRRNTFMLNVFK
ncbi:hypothetical protein QQF64_015418 [Cirrhinus molitorella]|uniref:Uncharacterized protein n=1 Tax=Cirrhinus molitorella TaxID=172907 RepID=A0ABR3NUU5_9TELE